jgi:hypothetical protein
MRAYPCVMLTALWRSGRAEHGARGTLFDNALLADVMYDYLDQRTRALPPTGGSRGNLHRTTRIHVHAPRRRGAIAIGHEHDEALALVIRCARDSMPQLRLAVLLDVATHPDSRVIEISERRACGASSAPMELAASSTRRRRAVNALAA